MTYSNQISRILQARCVGCHQTGEIAPFALTSPAPPLDRLGTARRYLTLGFTHIVPHGLDHMLFVLGIYLLSGRARSVLWQVSAFTVAHSITLGLSMYGIVAVSPRIVEPMTATSLRDCSHYM